jgi:hypothetical protein
VAVVVTQARLVQDSQAALVVAVVTMEVWQVVVLLLLLKVLPVVQPHQH